MPDFNPCCCMPVADGAKIAAVVEMAIMGILTGIFFFFFLVSFGFLLSDKSYNLYVLFYGLPFTLFFLLTFLLYFSASRRNYQQCMGWIAVTLMLEVLIILILIINAVSYEGALVTIFPISWQVCYYMLHIYKVFEIVLAFGLYFDLKKNPGLAGVENTPTTVVIQVPIGQPSVAPSMVPNQPQVSYYAALPGRAPQPITAYTGGTGTAQVQAPAQAPAPTA